MHFTRGQFDVALHSGSSYRGELENLALHKALQITTMGWCTSNLLGTISMWKIGGNGAPRKRPTKENCCKDNLPDIRYVHCMTK